MAMNDENKECRLNDNDAIAGGNIKRLKWMPSGSTHGFKYRSILIYIGNIVLDFEVLDTILTQEYRSYWG